MKKQEDTDKETDQVILKDYEKRIIEIIFDARPDPVSSRLVYDLLGDQGVKISRASVINFLNMLRDQNLVKYTEESGKGGMSGRYTPFMADTIKGLYTRISFDIMEQLLRELKDVNLLWCALNLQNPEKLLSKEEALIVTNAIVNTETDPDLIDSLVSKINWIVKLE